jgi:signal peptidase I
VNRPTAVPDVDSPGAADAVTAPQQWLWVRLVVASLCRSLLTMLVCLALWAAVPALLGWQPTTVSSGSMMPRLHVGDVSVAKPVTKAPSLQQVLLFHDPDHAGKLRLHRFVRVDDQGRMITRGDANPNDDSSPVTMDDLEGVAVLRVPYVALPIVWLREGRWLPLALVAAALLLVGAGARLNRGMVLDEPDQRPGSDGPAGGTDETDAEDHDADVPAQKRLRWTRPARAATAFVAVVTVLGAGGLLVAGPAWAGYSDTTTNPASDLAAATYYRCDNAVKAQNPYLYYELDETSGTTAADSSGNGRTGTLTGGYSSVAGGVCTSSVKTAITLNGSTGYVATPTQVTAPNTFTVQTWFKTTTTRGGRIIGFGAARTGASASVDRHIYMTNAGKLLFGVQTATNTRTTITSTANYNDGSWHLATASLSTAGMRLYVDGALVASRAATTTGISYTGYWRIGYDNLASWGSVPTSSFFAGTVAQAAVYSTALSANAIADIDGMG